MKNTIKLILPLLLAARLAPAQVVRIPHGAYVRLAAGTQVGLANMSMDVDGSLRCDSFTVIGIGGADEPLLSASQALQLYTLRTDGDAQVDADMMSVAGDIVMGSGKLNLTTATVLLRGEILGEREESHLTGGRVEKILSALARGERVSTGMGLTLAAAEGYDSLRVVRTHDVQHFRGEKSIAKSYALQPANAMQARLASAEVAFLNAQCSTPVETFLMYRETLTGMSWESVPAETHLSTKRVASKAAEPFEVSQITLFPLPELNFPKVFTPNGDGINDCFEILGIEKYQASKLVLLTPRGKVVREISPYQNDFCGEGLSAGTYFYMFFANASDTQPLKKGFFELIKSE